ncbi:MAG: hypothetical protein ACOC4K_02715 [Verrucomicrobiota bacterium]
MLPALLIPLAVSLLPLSAMEQGSYFLVDLVDEAEEAAAGRIAVDAEAFATEGDRERASDETTPPANSDAEADSDLVIDYSSTSKFGSDSGSAFDLPSFDTESESDADSDAKTGPGSTNDWSFQID